MNKMVLAMLLVLLVSALAGWSVVFARAIPEPMAPSPEAKTPNSWTQTAEALGFYTNSDTVVAQGIGDLEDLVLEVLCDSGDVVVGGGITHTIVGAHSSPRDFTSAPNPSGSGWIGRVVRIMGAGSELTVTARCAKFIPTVGGLMFFANDPSPSGGSITLLVGGIAGVLAVLIASGWYARRRWLSRRS